VTREEVLYPPLEAIHEAHRRLLQRYGGAAGVRDPGGVEAALARGRQVAAYGGGEADLFTLAAAIGFGFARIHHPFVDGNKRIAFYAVFATLWMNGWRLDVAEREAAAMIERVAQGTADEAAFAAWLQANALREGA
jgi:death-on-curing protein